VRVTNLANGRQVVVVIDDRGPFLRGRVIDLSVAAARRLGMVRDGVVPVRIQVLRWAEEPEA
jgi:rare lipoprotein A